MEHKHSFFIYNTGEGAYCMGCDMVIDQSEIQDLLNSHYNAAEHHMHTDAAKWNCPKCNYVNFSDERVCIVCETAAPVM